MMEAEVCENTTCDLKRKHDFMSNKFDDCFQGTGDHDFILSTE
jgi:hypothetical protein